MPLCASLVAAGYACAGVSLGMCFRLVLAARQDNSKQSVANLFHWWVPKEISEILGINNHRNVVSRLDEDKKGVHTVDTPGGLQQFRTVNERSRKAHFYKNIRPPGVVFLYPTASNRLLRLPDIV